MAKPISLPSVLATIEKLEGYVSKGKDAETRLPKLYKLRDKLTSPEELTKAQKSLEEQMKKLQERMSILSSLSDSDVDVDDVDVDDEVFDDDETDDDETEE